MDIGKILEQRDKAMDEMAKTMGGMTRDGVDKAMLLRPVELRAARAETLHTRIGMIERKRDAAVTRADAEIAVIRDEIKAVEGSLERDRDAIAAAVDGRPQKPSKRGPAKRSKA